MNILVPIRLTTEENSEQLKKAFLEGGEGHVHGSCRLMEMNSHEKWLNWEERCADGRVPSFVHMVFEDEQPIGVVDIRPFVKMQERHYGHISLSIIPQMRGKGYGTQALRQAEIILRGYNVTEWCISCHSTNKVAQHIIEKEGYRYTNSHMLPSAQFLMQYSKEVNRQ